MKFISSNWFKIVVASSLLFVAISIGYNFFVLIPKQQKFSNCMKSYDTNFKNSIVSNMKLSPADLCSRTVNFSDFVDLGKAIREQVDEEYNEKYANPEDPWIKGMKEKEIYETVREIILLI